MTKTNFLKSCYWTIKKLQCNYEPQKCKEKQKDTICILYIRLRTTWAVDEIGSFLVLADLFRFVILDCCLDSIFRKHRTVQFHWW